MCRYEVRKWNKNSVIKRFDMDKELIEYLKKEQSKMANASLSNYMNVGNKHRQILLKQICLCIDLRFKDIWLYVFKDKKECIEAFNVL